MSLCRAVLATILIFGAASPSDAQTPGRMHPTAPVPGKSLPAPGRVTRSFDARGVETVVLRAEAAEQAEVKIAPVGQFITVSGVPEGDAAGYHSPDPSWRETPASERGLDFKAKSFGPTLVVSTESEILYIHHYYHLGGLAISVPSGVKVVKENRKLTGDGSADLSPPAGR